MSSKKKTLPEKNKNIRLTHEAWHKLRLLKFKEGMLTYSAVFENIFEELGGSASESYEQVKSKFPKEEGDNNKDKQKDKQKDKTIVINESMHLRLGDFKRRYIFETGKTSRGPEAVSISDVVLAIIDDYATKKSIDLT